MAKARKDDGGSSELSQIILLTLGMTGAGLLLLYGVLQFWMIPNAQTEAESLARNYDKLRKLLVDDGAEMRRLWKEDQEKKEAGEDTKSQSVLIDEALTARRLEKDRFGPPGKESDGAQKQGITIKPAPIEDIFLFAVQVREARKTIEIHSIALSAPTRGAEPGKFGATVEFVDYGAPKDE